ncbi:MAG: hypothetical protein DRJ03_00865 [Chloroflexi bacterium]|nr:MAG: hypothetical protein DRJ03_00865 [Chloroflexota bacterium]
MEKAQCICCGNWLSVESLGDDPLTLSPVYDGLIFRASGNYGSTIFDPMPIGQEEYLQVIICDDCVKRNLKRVTRIYNIKHVVVSDVEEFTP